ncbi:MAG TPA: hypothetical protein PLY93_14550, partial [Turneriella sp.]|nr:hypothetical protein [Turneriella sp.]
YEWFDDAIVAKDEILQQKKTYLNKYFFIVRLIIYFTVWAYMGYAIRKNSNLQDEKKDAAIKLKLTKLSAAYTLIFAYSFLVATIDIVMSLQPHWFTTMFPVYTFANGWFGAIAAIIIILVTVQKNNALKDVSTEHLHDLGKWLLMSVVFWAYIAFSMHMLTWYANMPEETYFLEVRLQGNWKYFTVALWMLHFVIPFLILLSRDIKREGKRIVKVAWYSLFVTFLDIVWIVNGSVLGHEGGHTKVDDLPVSLVDLGLFIGVIGLGGIMFFKAFAKVNEAPTGDIDYETSRHFHQTF